MSSGIQATLQLTRPDFTLDVDMQLPDKGVSVLFGHSGSGKTTLLRCLAGLEKAQGELRFNDQLWQSGKQFLPTFKRPLAYVFQESSLFDHLTADGNLRFAMQRARGAVSERDYQHITGLLGIGHTLQRLPAQLSGGERQRVAIARALLSKPQLLLMDEPLASLDEQRKQEILPYLEQLKNDLDLPIIYVTHSAAEVARLADYLLALKGGCVVASGTLNETLTRMDFPLILGEDAGVVLQGRVSQRDGHWHLAQITFGEEDDGVIWLRDGGQDTGTAVRARILARDVSLALSPRDDSSIQNCLPCVVEAIGDDEHAALALVKVRVGNTALLSRMTRRSVQQLNLTPGLALWAQVKSAALV